MTDIAARGAATSGKSPSLTLHCSGDRFRFGNEATPPLSVDLCLPEIRFVRSDEAELETREYETRRLRWAVR
jgi:hypothetical protein